MVKVVGVRFQTDGKLFYYNSMDLNPQVGDYLIVNSGKGLDLCEVVLGIQEMNEDQLKSPLPQVERIATAQDIQRATENRTKEREAYRICQRKIAEHKLEMKLVSVESSFDNNKMVFYFTANGRVDFRALVKDLASVFRTRIELRQIGVRDEARMLGGLGPCGRQICCGAFLTDFQPVSIKMAKEQNLSLNPTKISGVCGRLMCCLKYEQDQYEQTRKRMPRIGREVVTPDGTGTVNDLNVVKETVSVRIPNGDNFEVREYTLDQITKAGQEAPTMPAMEAEKDFSAVKLDIRADGMPVSLKAGDPESLDVERSEIKADASLPSKQKRSRNPERPVKSTQRKNAEEDSRERKSHLPKQVSLSHSKKQGGANIDKPAREQKYGLPVRREKQNKRNEKSEAVKQEALLNVENKEHPDPKGMKKNGWVDAVERALAEADN